jgi:hypothetical protein
MFVITIMKHSSDNHANYILCRDNLPAVDVKTWYLHAHMFDGDVAAGPVPLLFAANPDVAAASIAAEPAKAHFDLSKVSF